uniref:Mitochondrial carrier protein n=1 Tax=Aureoumbra lagunensis TaxID=44058 RepID=A0A7S3K362_9STRA|mmetsp:Transcript_13388/g.16751  ORF Transcript_13388/g.16751 Transcript_13388/m.16751 type:complete len:354 (-) Transcript_13388:426-1487(-)
MSVEKRRRDVKEENDKVLSRRDTIRIDEFPEISGNETENEGLQHGQLEEKWWSTVVAGGIAGAVSRTCTAPLERLKILFQVQGLSAGAHPLRHTSIWPSLVALYKKDGLLGLWKGNGLNCIRVVPSSAVQFACYKFYREFFFCDDGSGHVQLKAWQHVIAGGLAGATSTICTYPLDLIRARRTVDFRGDVPSSLIGGLRHVLHTEGIPGLFRGIIPSLCGIFPYLGIDFAVFDLLKRYCRTSKIGLSTTNEELLPTTKLLCGAIAGVIGMTAAFPFDTVRRNLQVASLKVRHSEPPKTMITFMSETVRLHGVAALYRGIFPNYLKAAPSVAISFTTFEALKPFFDRLHPQDWL